MDESASKKFLEQTLKRLERARAQLGAEIQVTDGQIFILLPSVRFNRQFMLKATPDGSYPENPADYCFVNPKTKCDEGITHWPNNGGQAFKLENPPWICMEGTRAWIKHGHPNPGLQKNLIENVVFSIFAKLNKKTN